MAEELFDLLIIGGGPAGLSASIYASRHKMRHLVFEGSAPGGQIAWASHKVENYPGIASMTGPELGNALVEHAKGLGMEMKMETVNDIKRSEKGFCVRTDQGSYDSKTVIVATGATHRKLGVPGEDGFLGKGVSYCATCDAPFFKDKPVAMVGGGDAALTQAIYLADVCSEVHLVHRRDEFRADAANIEKVTSNPKIKIHYSSVLKEIKGSKFVDSIVLESTKEGKAREEVKVDGVFIYVGNVPASALAKQAGAEVDEKGFIKVDWKMRTNVPGLYAAGDITGHTLQMVVACSEGAIAAMDAYVYMKKLEGKDIKVAVNR